VLVRHNTSLLEQAIDLQVKRSAIPALEAEAAAHDKIARANAFRRMATGAAIAIAAIGIGVGAMLIFGSGKEPKPSTQETAEKQPETTSAEESVIKRTQEEPVDIPPTPKKQEERVVEEGKSEWPKADKSPGRPQDPTKSPQPDPPATPNPLTEDFTKFVHRDVFFQGVTWNVSSGHQFETENSPNWETAWCYTRRTVNDVDLNLQLVNRPSPSAKPQAPVSSPATFASVGLTEEQARELASKCEWLDGVSFAPDNFDPMPGRPELAAFIVQDGWDALGHDLPNMPIRNVSLQQCQSQCEGDHRCLALTYNKTHSACFMKGDATILIRDDHATTSAKQVVAGNLQQSPLVFAKNTVIVGNGYSSRQISYADCVMACAIDQSCAGFNFDANKVCTLLDRAVSSSDFRGVSSGLKATN
jgi:hypothetical protein